MIELVSLIRNLRYINTKTIFCENQCHFAWLTLHAQGLHGRANKMKRKRFFASQKSVSKLTKINPRLIKLNTQKMEK